MFGNALILDIPLKIVMLDSNLIAFRVKSKHSSVVIININLKPRSCEFDSPNPTRCAKKKSFLEKVKALRTT